MYQISEYFAKETGIPCVMNIWTGDGFKDIPADRMGPRMRYKDSIEQILSEKFDFNMVKAVYRIESIWNRSGIFYFRISRIHIEFCCNALR